MQALNETQANSLIQAAALFMCKHDGLRGTEKQVAKYIKNVGPFVVRMALQRGFKPA